MRATVSETYSMNTHPIWASMGNRIADALMPSPYSGNRDSNHAARRTGITVEIEIETR